MKAEEVLRKYEEWYRGNYNDDTVILHPFYVEKFLGELTEEDEEVSGEFAKFIKQQYKDAWDKMGSTGADDYWETATKDEIFEFGRFRATEDIKDFLDSKFSR